MGALKTAQGYVIRGYKATYGPQRALDGGRRIWPEKKKKSFSNVLPMYTMILMMVLNIYLMFGAVAFMH